jgi:hypothetical protein
MGFRYNDKNRQRRDQHSSRGGSNPMRYGKGNGFGRNGCGPRGSTKVRGRRVTDKIALREEVAAYGPVCMPL